MKKAITRILALVAAFVCGGAWAAAPNPVFLVNFTSDSEVDVEGWYDHYQNGGKWLGGENGFTDNGITFSTTGNGNFFPYAAVSTDYLTGSYSDLAGGSHTSLMDEVKTSLGLDAEIPESVYKTGLMNGGFNGHTATISGLNPQKRYVAYFGYGIFRSDTSYAGGFTIRKGGFASVAKLEYVATVKGYNWMVEEAGYTSFDIGTDVKPGKQGLLLVRATDIVPTEEGKIEFVLGGDHAGMNFLALAELGSASDTSIQTTVEGGEVSWDDLVWKRGGVVCDAPGASDDCEIVIAADTQISIPSTKEVRVLTVGGEGALRIGMSGSQQLTVSELVANTDVRFEPATLSPGLVTIAADKTVQYYMYSNATIPGICGPGTFEAFVGTEETPRTLTLTRNGTIDATVSGATVKVHYGTVHLNEPIRLTNTRFDLDEGTQITQYGWAGISGTLEVFVDEGKSASAFTQSKINADAQSTFKKTGLGTLEMNAAICTSSASVQEGTLLLATANGWQHTAAISSEANGRLVKKGDSNVANFAGALNLHGGLEIQESGHVTVSAATEGVIFGVKGPGELTLSGNGALVLGRWKNDTANTASVNGSVITVSSSTLRFGNAGVQDGSLLKDCSINFNGGNASAYGWITLDGTVIVNVEQDCTMAANPNNRTQGSTGTLVKRGTSTLQWNSHIDTAVTIEDGTLDKVSNTNFTIGDAVSIKFEGLEAKLTVPESKVLTNTSTSLEKYRVARTVEEGVATYALERRGGFVIQIQ